MIVILNSVGCVLNDETGMVFPLFNDGTFDVSDDATAVHLSDCNEEFFENLDADDSKVVAFYLWFLYKRGTLFKGLPNPY